MAYSWDKVKGDGTETTAEIMAKVHCCRETIYRRANVNPGFKFLKIPANERAQRLGRKQNWDRYEKRSLLSARYPEVEPEKRPLEGFSSAPSNYVLDIYGGLL